MSKQENTLWAIAAGAILLLAGKRGNSVGAITKTQPPGRIQCRDGSFSTLPQGPGVCSYHGGSVETVARKKRAAANQQNVVVAPIETPALPAPPAATPFIAPPVIAPRTVEPWEMPLLDYMINKMNASAQKGFDYTDIAVNAYNKFKEELGGWRNGLPLNKNGENMYRNELIIKYTNLHRGDIVNALREGKSVPKAVLADYEDLKEATQTFPLAGIESHIPYTLAFNAHRNTSFSPERRAVSEINDYVTFIKETYNKLAKGRTPEQIQALNSEFSRFVKGYRDRYLSYLSSRGNVLSVMIVGPSKFPTRRNEKANNAADNKLKEVLAFEEKVLQKISNNVDIYPEKRLKAPIRSGDSDALQRLREKLAVLERNQAKMVESNKIIRSGKDVIARLVELGFTESQANKILIPDYARRVGFPSYALTNNNAEIRRLKERIAAEENLTQQREIAAEAPTEQNEIPFPGGKIYKNLAANRLQIFFDDIPPADLREKLKKRGFRWAPSEKAWQRQLTRDAESAAYNILNIQIATIGAIFNRVPRGISYYRCKDGTYSDSGFCNWHGGLRSPTPVKYNIVPSNANVRRKVQKVVMESAAPQRQDTGVTLVPIQTVREKREWFQNRATPYSERSVSSITDAVQSGTFRWVNFDPITVWADPAGKLFVLSGHSRLEAFKRLCAARSIADGRDFCNIPAKIAANLTLEQAKQIALESNTLSTKETDLERAGYYLSLRTREGKNITELRDIAKRLEGNNAAKILAFSFLNTSGKTYNALVALDNADQTSRANIQNIARWIGNARITIPALNDRHENELYDWLVDMRGYGTSKGQISNETEFRSRLAAIIAKRTTFGVLDESLNIQNSVYRSPVEMQYDQQIAEAKDQMDSIDKELKAKVTDLTRRGATEAQVQEVTAALEATLRRARVAYQNLLLQKGKVAEAAKNEMALFGFKKRYAWQNH